MSIKIGFPRALFYYLYFPFWHEFFSGLGYEVVTSSLTSKSNMDMGIKEAVNDACLPVKIYHGHTVELKNKVDLLFLPRMIRVRKYDTETFCPKFLGLPDMIKNSLQDLPPLIEADIDLIRGRLSLWRVCHDIAGSLKVKNFRIEKAFLKGLLAQDRFKSHLAQGYLAQQAIDATLYGTAVKPSFSPQSDFHLAVLGYPYLIYDNFANEEIFEKLSQMAVKVSTVEMVNPSSMNRYKKSLPKNLFWNFSNRTIQAAFYYLQEQKIDGIIHLTAFGCGPDAVVGKLIELMAKEKGRVPFMTLSLDEHSGQAGIITRLEAFVDMLRLTRGKSEKLLKLN